MHHPEHTYREEILPTFISPRYYTLPEHKHYFSKIPRNTLRSKGKECKQNTGQF